MIYSVLSPNEGMVPLTPKQKKLRNLSSSIFAGPNFSLSAYIYCVPNNVISVVTLRNTSNKTSPLADQHKAPSDNIYLEGRTRGNFFFLINTFGSLVLCFAVVLQSLRKRACWKISYIIHFIFNRPTRSSMINISTEPENGHGSLKLHYVTLPPNENPIKSNNYPYPIRGGCLCASELIFSLSKATSYKAILPLNLPSWVTDF